MIERGWSERRLRETEIDSRWGGGVHDMTVCCTLYVPVYFCVQCTYKCAPSTYTVHCIDIVCII